VNGTRARLSRRGVALVAGVDTWHVAPVDQGQTVEVAYGFNVEAEQLVRRSTDRADGRVVYSFGTDPVGPFEPWNRPPRARRWTVARPLEVAR
jgi:hypothetical protein